MKGHEHARSAIRDVLETWVPIRLLLIRELLDVQTPVDPACYLLADELPDNDPSRYPCIVVRSSRVVGMTRRSPVAASETAVFDVDYEMDVVVACERSEYAGDEVASRDRDRLMLAVRECFALPLELDEATYVPATPFPQEQTGASQQTLRGNPLAAGVITVRVRCAEALIPNDVLASIVGADVTAVAFDASASSIDPSE